MTQYNKDGFKLEWNTDFLGLVECKNDIQVTLRTKNDKYLADAVCHYGSYGQKNGLWEIMVEHPLKSWGDSVLGHLTWKEVMKYFDREIKLYIKSLNK